MGECLSPTSSTPSADHVYIAAAALELVNRCFHGDAHLTGDDLAVEVRCPYLDSLVDLGPTEATRRRVTGVAAGPAA